jgi:hypothetical protein
MATISPSTGMVAGDHELARPLLLGTDDGNDLAVDRDGRRLARADLRLLVVEPGDQSVVVLAGLGGDEGQQRLELHQQDLVDPSTGAQQEHQRVERLGVPEAALVLGPGQQLGALGDVGDGVVLEDHVGGESVGVAGGVLGADERGVLGTEQQPAGLVEDVGRLGPMVVHEPVETPDRHHRLRRTVGPSSLPAVGPSATTWVRMDSSSPLTHARSSVGSSTSWGPEKRWAWRWALQPL